MAAISVLIAVGYGAFHLEEIQQGNVLPLLALAYAIWGWFKLQDRPGPTDHEDPL